MIKLGQNEDLIIRPIALILMNTQKWVRPEKLPFHQKIHYHVIIWVLF